MTIRRSCRGSVRGKTRRTPPLLVPVHHPKAVACCFRRVLCHGEKIIVGEPARFYSNNQLSDSLPFALYHGFPVKFLLNSRNYNMILVPGSQHPQTTDNNTSTLIVRRAHLPHIQGPSRQKHYGPPCGMLAYIWTTVRCPDVAKPAGLGSDTTHSLNQPCSALHLPHAI